MATHASNLDDEFRRRAETIKKLTKRGHFSTHTRARDKWLDKLAEPGATRSWKRVRNDYAMLLHMQVRGTGTLEAPFNRVPPQGQVPRLSPRSWLKVQRHRPWADKRQGQGGAGDRDGRISAPGHKTKVSKMVTVEIDLVAFVAVGGAVPAVVTGTVQSSGVQYQIDDSTADRHRTSTTLDGHDPDC